MLETLRISGLALLRDCDLELSPGLTVISGETGAGKTVLLTSLRLLTGGRADPTMVRAEVNRTEIDSVARVDQRLADDLDEAGFAVEDGEVTFSRTVPADGRSRGAISGRPVPVKTLADTLGTTITIHGQADQWRLKGPTAQRQLLDGYGGAEHQRVLEDYKEAWDHTNQLRERFRQLSANHEQQQIELQYLRETAYAIDQMGLLDDEEEQLDSSIDRLTNVQELREDVGAAVSLFDGEQALGPTDALGRVAETLRRAQRQDASLAEYEERATQLEVEAVALAADLRVYVESLLDDPDELSRLHERRAKLTELMRGRATTVPELLSWSEEARRRVAELEDESSDPDAVSAQLRAAELGLGRAAAALTKSRTDAATRLSETVNQELAELALGGARFGVQIDPQQPGPAGADRVTMTLQPHPSAPSAPISQGASGGELSRIMLALEVSLAQTDVGRTFVFDEIDAGIGGTTVVAVANRLRSLADHQQVIVVTHQPQIAAVADANFVVSKSNGVATVSAVKGPARTDEIVRMLGGETEATRRHAEELEAKARRANSIS